MASLIVDFLQVFNLDFTLTVFQPETNSVSFRNHSQCEELLLLLFIRIQSSVCSVLHELH